MLKHKLAHTLTTNVSNSNIREKVSDFTYAHEWDAWDAYDERYLTPLAVCECVRVCVIDISHSRMCFCSITHVNAGAVISPQHRNAIKKKQPNVTTNTCSSRVQQQHQKRLYQCACSRMVRRNICEISFKCSIFRKHPKSYGQAIDNKHPAICINKPLMDSIN